MMLPFHPNRACRADAAGPSNERHAGEPMLLPERTAVKQGD